MFKLQSCDSSTAQYIRFDHVQIDLVCLPMAVSTGPDLEIFERGGC